MKIVGTICEYNPFHNGHLYSLQKIKDEAKPDVLIVCLSTYFTMRGDLSLHSPYLKASYALSVADLVVALPSVLAVNSASIFANNAVRELAKLGVNEIYCGSESANLDYIKNINFSEDKLKEQLSLHKSYKKATSNIIDIAPNDLLAYTYYQAIINNNYPIELKLIKRIGDKHDYILPEDNQYTSSTAIRQNLSLIQNYCPDFVSSQNLFHYEKFYRFFQFQIINNPLPQHPILANGLDKHLKKSAKDANSFAELLKYATNSYFTTTKIKRAIFYLLFNVNPFSNYYPYSRVLGFNSRGQNYLRQIKKQSKIITNNKMDLSPILDYELKIASIFDLIFASHCLSDELKEPIIIK